MANTLLTPAIIAKEALMLLENNLVMGALVHREYKQEFVKIGSSVTIRKPINFTAQDGVTRVNQDATENSTSITINKRKHVSWNFSSQDLTLTIEEYSKRFIKPAMLALANQMDYDVCGQFANIYRSVGTAGTTPSTFANSVQIAGQKLDEMSVPQDERRLVLNPAAYWSLAGSLLSLYVQNVAEDVKLKGYLGQFGNFNTYLDQNVQSQTNGAITGTPVVNGANQTGATVTISGATGGTYNAGDVITFAGCFDVNPVSKAAMSYLKQFTVTATSAASPTSISISPSITVTGPYQNCSASPTNSGAVTQMANHVANLAFHKNALALVVVPLEKPDGAPFSAFESYKDLNVRIVKSYDINNDVDIIRLDIMYGTAAIYPDLACRLMG